MRTSILVLIALLCGCSANGPSESASGATGVPGPAGPGTRIVLEREGGPYLDQEIRDAVCRAVASSRPAEDPYGPDYYAQVCPGFSFSTSRRTESLRYWDNESSGPLGLELRVSASNGEQAWDARLVHEWGAEARFEWTAAVERVRSEAVTTYMAERLRDLARRDTYSVEWGRAIGAIDPGLVAAEVREDAEIDAANRNENDRNARWVVSNLALTVKVDGQSIGTVVGLEDTASTIGLRGKLLWYDAFGRWVLESDVKR